MQSMGESPVSRLLLVLLPILLAICFLPINQIVKRGSDCVRCEMSIMMADYLELTDQLSSPLTYKYRLFKYEDFSAQTPEGEGDCIPVLFVPGNSGSYRQVRSIGSEILAQQSDSKKCFDIFAVDFRGEFGAFSGHRVNKMIDFVATVIDYLISSDEIILLGHSLGGIVVMNALERVRKPIKVTLLTMASPLKDLPLNICHKINTLLQPNHEDFRNFELTSIRSGLNDILVPAEMSFHERSKNIVPEQLIGNGAIVTHDTILWEKGITRSIANFLIKNKSISEASAARYGNIEIKKSISLNDLHSIASSRENQVINISPQENSVVFISKSITLPNDKDLLSWKPLIGSSMKLTTRLRSTTMITEKYFWTSIEGGQVRNLTLNINPSKIHEMTRLQWDLIIGNGVELFDKEYHKLALTVRKGTPAKIHVPLSLKDIFVGKRIIIQNTKLNAGVVKLIFSDLPKLAWYQLHSTSPMMSVQLTDHFPKYDFHKSEGLIRRGEELTIFLRDDYADTVEFHVQVSPLKTLSHQISTNYDKVMLKIIRNAISLLTLGPQLSVLSFLLMTDTKIDMQLLDNILLLIVETWSLIVSLLMYIVISSLRRKKGERQKKRLWLSWIFVHVVPRVIFWTIEVKNWISIANEMQSISVLGREMWISLTDTSNLLQDLSLSLAIFLGYIQMPITFDGELSHVLAMTEIQRLHQLPLLLYFCLAW